MEVEMTTGSDPLFKIDLKAQKETTPEPVVEDPEPELPLDYSIPPQRGVPIENPKGLDWFKGTSWGN